MHPAVTCAVLRCAVFFCAARFLQSSSTAVCVLGMLLVSAPMQSGKQANSGHHALQQHFREFTNLAAHLHHACSRAVYLVGPMSSARRGMQNELSGAHEMVPETEISERFCHR